MSTATLTTTAAGQLAVAGPMTFATAGELLRASQALFPTLMAPDLMGAASGIAINLQKVSTVDSAGLALLLEWLRWGRSGRRAVAFHHLPEKLVAIARLSGVDELLVAGYSPTGASGSASSGPASSG